MRVNWDYIAGFFDGEGSVSMMNFTHRDSIAATIVTLSQSGDEGVVILTAIRDFLWACEIKGYMQKVQKRPPYRPMYNLKICARPSVMAFLTEMLPRISVKRVAVQDVLRFYRVFPATLRQAVTIERNKSRGKYGAVNLDPVILRAELLELKTLKAVAAKHAVNVYTIKKYLDPNYRVAYDRYRTNWRLKKKLALQAQAIA